MAAYRARGERDEFATTSAFSTEERVLLAYLEDAELYVEALSEGVPPAQAIAEARTISKRSAEGRILKARRLGLLTPARGKQASGELTEKARRLVATRGRLQALEERRRNG